MYLKEISTTGFKSFADKITINLDGKITAIVGPNGSGKSNVVDAVRWVLGEQSVKSLRGTDNMTDVIFSGSKSRNPLNVASVSLTFDNSDNYLNIPYNEVSIKRRVYRSGESEYFLNNEKCRLKDITDLLIDTATARESFNIISQGEIQKILSNSAYDRRLIFESAAGVLKYKKRKEEAIRKLERTSINIERVIDIISELELQLGPLEEQSKKAKEYVTAKNKLKDVEIALLVTEIENITRESNQNDNKINQIKNQLLEIDLKTSSLDLKIENNKLELYKREEELKEKNRLLFDLIRKEEKLNGEKELFKERSKYDSSDSKVHSNITQLKEDLYQTENSIKLMQSDNEYLKIDLDSLVNENNKESQNLIKINSDKENNYTEINNTKRNIFDINNQIEAINNNVESNNILPYSIKAVLNNPRLKGIHNTIANLIDCEDKYLDALEVAILSSKNYIVVDDEVTAKNAINYLKDNNLGRATFYPLNVIKPRGIDIDTQEKLKKIPGYIGVLGELITFSKEYYNVIHNQLGNVIVTDNLDNANKISSETQRRYKIVTLGGDVINVGGSMVGGSKLSTKSILAFKRDLENLLLKKKEKEELLLELEKASRVLEEEYKNSTSKVISLNSKIINVEEKKKVKDELIKELEARKDDLEKESKSLESVVSSSLSKEEERIFKEFYEVSLEKDNLVKEISFLEVEKDKLSEEILALEADNKLNRSEVSSQEKTLKHLEIENSKMDIRLDNYLNTLSDEYSLTFERARDNFILELDITLAREEVYKLKDIIKNIGMVNLDAIEDYDRVKERYDFLTGEQADLSNAKDTLLEIINEMDEVMKEEFVVTFEKVRVEFKKVFKELFSGGEADLLLTDKDNILETGIEILASPPGKKLKSITLLSGGEMTLTAISLIFAILNIKSVPFCIFDEVEAALDESNVDNFGKYLERYKDKTQFLIITHKKKTMEYADTLYGITMQESGVSKLVSVRLSKLAE